MFKYLLLLLVLNISVCGLGFQSDSLTVKSDSLFTDSAKVRIVDTLYAIQVQPFYSYSYFHNRTDFLFSDYRHTSDLLSQLPNSFIRNFGFINHPNEAIIYGAGYNGVSYFGNSVLLNHRFSNSLDLNYIQNESIDSIEIIPPSRSFLYGTDNNLAAVNFIPRNLIPPAPYTRLKYYEASYEEGFLDFQFNTMFFNKLNLSADILNKKTGNSFKNTESSFWQADIKLTYFISNSANISGGYFHNTSKVGLNGGINVDSLAKRYSSVNSVMYDPITAFVKVTDRYQKNSTNLLTLKGLFLFDEYGITEFNIYFKNVLDEFRQNENYTVSGLDYIKNDEQEKIAGAVLTQKLKLSVFNLDLTGFFEKRDLLIDSDYDITKNLFGFSGNLSLNLINNSIIPSIFTKTVYYDDYVYNGLGGDIKIQFDDNFSVYFGLSRFERFWNYFPTANSKPFVISADGAIDYEFLIFKIRLHLFRREFDKEQTELISGTSSYYVYSPKSDYGAGLSLKSKWKFLETDISFTYFESENSIGLKNSVPGVSGNASIVYSDTHFDSSLTVKTGFSIKFSGERAYSKYEPFRRLISYDVSQNQIESFYTVDFFAAGEIKQSAILYFTFENILDTKYYIVPFYPMPARGIRFGVAWELYN